MLEQAVDVMMTSEVGDDRAGRRHDEQDHSGMVARDNAAYARNAMTATLKSTRCARRSQCRVARASETLSATLQKRMYRSTADSCDGSYNERCDGDVRWRHVVNTIKQLFSCSPQSCSPRTLLLQQLYWLPIKHASTSK